mgnify:CR=1 FL=1
MPRPLCAMIQTGLVSAALALTPVAASAQEAAIYSSMDAVHPVWAKSAMVSVQEKVAAEVGLQVLKDGGNAVDAGVAVALALAVTLPRAGNLGGGGFMLVHDAKSGKTKAIDYREMAPASATRDMYLDAEGNADSNLSRFHGLAVGVPGTVAGLQLALETYGTMTLAEAAAPAIRLAEDGITVTADLADSLKALEKRLKASPASAAIFYKPDGGFYEPGDTLKQADLAATLRKIADEGPDGFYRGAVAEAISSAVADAGGSMSLDDLANYKAVIREPVSGTYRGHEIVSMPPPSSGGTHIIQILNVMEGYPIGFLGHNSSDTIHLMAEAMKRAYADRSEYLGDPDFNSDMPIPRLTSKAYAAEQRLSINAERASVSSPTSFTWPAESSETTHFSVVDRDRNAVSLTYTLEFGYGSGIVVPGAGFLLNNEMGDFNAGPGLTDDSGLIGSPANLARPQKRMLSSMTPSIVARDGRLVAVVGSPGGRTIINTVAQVILNVIDFGMNIQMAVNAPRIHHQWLPDRISIEGGGASAATVERLEAMGHTVRMGGGQGSANSIMIDPRTRDRLGAADPRRSDAGARGH